MEVGRLKLPSASEQHRENVRCRPIQIPTEIKSTGITEAIIEHSEADFTTPNALDTAILQFTTLVLSPPLQEATGEVFDNLDNDDELSKLVVPPPLSPCKPKPKTGPKRQATTDLAHKFRPPTTHPTWKKQAFTTEFKLEVLSYATYGRVDDGKGGLRAPKAKEVCTRYNLKNIRYLHRWRQEEETLLLMKPLQKRHRPSQGRWPKLEKVLVQAFAERRKEGKTVRKKWFEWTAKALFLQLYPTSPIIFVVSNGWFN